MTFLRHWTVNINIEIVNHTDVADETMTLAANIAKPSFAVCQ